jgi:hypothetical protein
MDFEVAPPDQVLWIWRTLEEAGFETWIVGGAIRDLMLGRPADDWDFATRAHPDRIMGVFRRTVPIGLDPGSSDSRSRQGRGEPYSLPFRSCHGCLPSESKKR